MHNGIPVAVVQCTGNLPAKLPCLFLFQTPVRDNVVKHLPTINIFAEHIPVVIGFDDISHAAYVWVVQQCDYGSFSGGSDLFAFIVFWWKGGSSGGVNSAIMDEVPRYDLHRNLKEKVLIW